MVSRSSACNGLARCWNTLLPNCNRFRTSRSRLWFLPALDTDNAGPRGSEYHACYGIQSYWFWKRPDWKVWGELWFNLLRLLFHCRTNRRIAWTSRTYRGTNFDSKIWSGWNTKNAFWVGNFQRSTTWIVSNSFQFGRFIILSLLYKISIRPYNRQCFPTLHTCYLSWNGGYEIAGSD